MHTLVTQRPAERESLQTTPNKKKKGHEKKSRLQEKEKKLQKMPRNINFRSIKQQINENSNH